MSETTFKDRVSEMIKNKISPTHTMDDECDQMWTEILIQVFELLCLDCSVFFSIYVFCGEATKKTSIDGLKWRDLVMGTWWLVNFNVSGVTKGFMC